VRRLSLSVFAIMLSIQVLGQSNQHILEGSFNDQYSHQVYCNVPPDHKEISCNISVSPSMFGPRIVSPIAYRVRNGQSGSLKVTSNFLGYQSEDVSVYKGDFLVMQWNGGRFVFQVGRGWTVEQWAGYVQRLTALCDWERSPEGIRAFQQKFQRDMGFPIGGSGPMPGAGGSGFSRPCSVVQDQIRMVTNNIASEERSQSVMQGSIWSGSTQGMISQNRQTLSDLQQELSTCSN